MDTLDLLRHLSSHVSHHYVTWLGLEFFRFGNDALKDFDDCKLLIT